MSVDSIKAISQAYMSMLMENEIPQERLPRNVFLDASKANWDIQHALKAIDNDPNYSIDDIIGVGGVSVNPMAFVRLNRFDRSLVSSIRLKSGEFICRYISPQTAAGSFMPLIKVSILNGMVYFLTQESSEGEVDDIRFESRGTKVRYIRLLLDFASQELGVV